MCISYQSKSKHIFNRCSNIKLRSMISSPKLSEPNSVSTDAKPLQLPKPIDISASLAKIPRRVSQSSKPPVPDGSKYCPGCRENHPLSDFGKYNSKKNGINTYCKVYVRERSRMHRLK